MGFERDISQILTFIRQQTSASQKSVQTILLSATLNSNVKRLAGISLHDPITVDVASNDSNRQVRARCPSVLRIQLVLWILEYELYLSQRLLIHKLPFQWAEGGRCKQVEKIAFPVY